jgi:pimeloyl-ACP methyl ester carboxylesterase
MVDPLARHGFSTLAVELPSCGAGGSLHDDADAVLAALDGTPVVLVGHSYGGMVITDVATLPARQREFASRATRVVEIPTGHHPFLSQPDLFAQVIASSTEIVGGRA